MGWTPETFWGSTLHEFYRFAVAHMHAREAEEDTTRLRMSWLMWAAGVTWKENMEPSRLYEMLTPRKAPREDSPVIVFKRKWLESRGISAEDSWLQ